MRMIKKINSFFSPVDSAELFLVRSEVTIDVGLNKDEDTREGNLKRAVTVSFNSIILCCDPSIVILLHRDLPIMLKMDRCLYIMIILHRDTIISLGKYCDNILL